MAAVAHVDELISIVTHETPDQVAGYISAHPALNVHAVSPRFNCSPFERACCGAHLAVMESFLACPRPQFDINHTSRWGWSPLQDLIRHARGTDGCAVMRRMLALSDLRLDYVNTTNLNCLGWSAFAMAACRSLKMMKLLIASGKPLAWTSEDLLAHHLGLVRLREIVAVCIDYHSCMVEAAEERLELLDEFAASPVSTRHCLQLDLASEFGCLGGAAAYAPAVAHHLFACIVFLSDDFLNLRCSADGVPDSIGRFLAMSMSLPLELQMIVSQRVAGLGKDVITSAASETAFLHLVSVF